MLDENKIDFIKSNKVMSPKYKMMQDIQIERRRDIEERKEYEIKNEFLEGFMSKQGQQNESKRKDVDSNKLHWNKGKRYSQICLSFFA